MLMVRMQTDRSAPSAGPQTCSIWCGTQSPPAGVVVGADVGRHWSFLRLADDGPGDVSWCRRRRPRSPWSDRRCRPRRWWRRPTCSNRSPGVQHSTACRLASVMFLIAADQAVPLVDAGVGLVAEDWDRDVGVLGAVLAQPCSAEELQASRRAVAGPSGCSFAGWSFQSSGIRSVWSSPGFVDSYGLADVSASRVLLS